MRTPTLIAALIAVIPLTACGVSGFADEDAKELAWEAYRCDSYGNVSAGMEQTRIHIDALNNNIPPAEEADAQHWARRLGNADTVGDVMTYESGPGYNSLCSGWLWERHKATEGYWRGYDDFTYDDAASAGVFGET